MRSISLGLIAFILASCTNVVQMQKRYEAGDVGQLEKLIEITSQSRYPYATRRKAARALGEIGDRRAVPALVAVLLEYEQRTTLKQEAVRALARIGDRQAVEPIGRMLDYQLGTNSAEVRMAAVQALGDLGGDKAAEILINALRYYDLLMLRDEQRSYRGIFSGEEEAYAPGPARADTTGVASRGPSMGLFPEGEIWNSSLFGRSSERQQEPYNPTSEERALAHASLVRVGEEGVPVLKEYLARKELTYTLRQELLAILDEIERPAAREDSSQTDSPAFSE